MTDDEFGRNLQMRWRRILDDTPDAAVLEMAPKFEALKEKNPLVWDFIRPELERRVAKARKSS